MLNLDIHPLFTKVVLNRHTESLEERAAPFLLQQSYFIN